MSCLIERPPVVSGRPLPRRRPRPPAPRWHGLQAALRSRAAAPPSRHFPSASIDDPEEALLSWHQRRGRGPVCRPPPRSEPEVRWELAGERRRKIALESRTERDDPV